MQTVYAVMLPTSTVLHLPLAHVSLSTLRKSDSLRRPLGSLNTLSNEDCKLFLRKILYLSRKISAVSTHFEILACVTVKDSIPGSYVMSNYDHRLPFRHYNVCSIAFHS